MVFKCGQSTDSQATSGVNHQESPAQKCDSTKAVNYVLGALGILGALGTGAAWYKGFSFGSMYFVTPAAVTAVSIGTLTGVAIANSKCCKKNSNPALEKAATREQEIVKEIDQIKAQQKKQAATEEAIAEQQKKISQAELSLKEEKEKTITKTHTEEAKNKAIALLNTTITTAKKEKTELEKQLPNEQRLNELESELTKVRAEIKDLSKPSESSSSSTEESKY